MLVEAAWHYRRRPKDTPTRRRELAEGPSWLAPIVRRADERLCGRFRRLEARRKPPQKIVLAVARELIGFMWRLGTRSISGSSRQPPEGVSRTV